MKKTILILEPKDYSKKALAMYQSLGQVFLYPELREQKRDKILQKINILVIRLAHRIDSSWFDTMPNLQIIATPTTGLNHIDLDEAKKRGIKIISLRGHTSFLFLKDVPSTAELTIGLMLALTRNIPWAFDDVKKGQWNRDQWKGCQLYKKTLGIFGCGRLGTLVAGYANAFGMEVIGYDPNVSLQKMKRRGIKKVELGELFESSDVVTIHAIFDKTTESIVQEKHFRMMKPSAYIVNTARGEIIEKGALLKALQKKWIAGAAVDVLRDEDAAGKHLMTYNRALLDYARNHLNLLIVPHIGGATEEAMHVTEEFIAEKTLLEFQSHKF